MEGGTGTALLALLLALSIAGVARAGAPPVEFWFRGDVQAVTDTHGVLDGSVHAGANLTGRIFYYPVTADESTDPKIGAYLQPSPPGAFVLRVGSYTVAPPSVHLVVYNDFYFGFVPPPYDSFSWRFAGATVAMQGAPAVSIDSVYFWLDDITTSAWASDALPIAPVDLADFSSTSFTIGGCLDAEVNDYFCDPAESIVIAGVLTSVPEPGACAGAFAAFFALARRRRARLVGPRARSGSACASRRRPAPR